MKKHLTFFIFIFSFSFSFSQMNIIGNFNEKNDSVNGKLFKVDTAGNNYAEVFSFHKTTDGIATPHQNLVELNSKLYGVTSGSNTVRCPVIFEHDLLTGNYKTLFRFTGAIATCTPLGLAAYGSGKLIGMAQTGGANSKGFIYTIDIVTKVYTKVYDFNGTNGGSPKFWLVNTSGSVFYGTAQEGANNCGVIFKFDASTNTYTKLYDFTQATSGKDPGALTYDATNNVFYSTCKNGGTNNNGTLFRFDAGTNTYTKFVDFNLATCTSNTTTTYGGYPGPNVSLAFNKLWLQTAIAPCVSTGFNNAGYVLTYKLSTNKFEYTYFLGNYQTIEPTDAYTNLDRTNIIALTDTTFFTNQPLPYSNTSPQGDNGVFLHVNIKKVFGQTIFAIPMRGYYNITVPASNLLKASNGKYYGTGIENFSANLGFPFGGYGGLYEFDLPLQKMKNTKLFNEYSYGTLPFGINLVDNCDIIGHTTTSNEISGGGTIYRHNLTSGTTTKIFSALDSLGRMFFGNWNYTEYSSPILVGNKYIGIIGLKDKCISTAFYPTYITGSIIYELDKTTQVYKILYDCKKMNPGFDGVAQLVQSGPNKLIGLASAGGASNYGCIFEYDLITNIPSIKFSFNNSTDAANPQNPLCLASNGKYYFTSRNGGAFGRGSICELDPLTYTVTKKFDFSNSSPLGYFPESAMVERAGKLYTTTTWLLSSSGSGCLIKYDISSNTTTNIFTFGAYVPELACKGNILFDGLNSIYMAATGGGLYSRGGIVKYNIVTGVATTLYSFLSTQQTSGGISMSKCGLLSGITDINNLNKNEIHAYPNPFTNELKINYVLANDNNEALIKLIEPATGRLLMQQEVKENKGITKFNTEHLSAGIYLISVEQKNEAPIIIKVVNTK